MACFFPFNNRNLDITFSVLRPTIVIVDDLVDSLKEILTYAETLGCVHSSIFKSIHGNMIIWYGAWIKRSDQDREMLYASITSMLSNLSNMSTLMDISFLEAYAGESKDGSPTAMFSTGDIISLNGAIPLSPDTSSLSYAFLALFKSTFSKIEGVRSGVCLTCPTRPKVVCANVWKSLHSYYSWVLSTDARKTMQPFVDHLSSDIKYDIYRVAYVSSDNVLNYQLFPHRMLGKNEGDNKDEDQKMKETCKCSM